MTEYRVRVGSSRFGDAREDRVVDVFATPLSDSDGRITPLSGAHHGRQDRRQLVSRGAARSVTGLAAMLAHEIKNPLSGIRGAAQLPNRASPPMSCRSPVLIRDEVDRIVDLIDRVEVFGDDRPVEREPINIHVILDRVSSWRAAVSPRASASWGLRSLAAAGRGHRDQLIQVFLNLVKNAASARTHAQARDQVLHGLPARHPHFGAGRGRAHLAAARDHHRGQWPGRRPIWCPSCSIPSATTKANGSGLGLALVAKIIGDHGGVVDMDSRRAGPSSAFCCRWRRVAPALSRQSDEAPAK